MILKKVVINDKEVFEPISYEEALAYENKDELIFTSEDEKEEFEEHLEELEELTEVIDELNEKVEELLDELDDVNENSKQSILMRLEEIKNELEGYKGSSDEDLEDKLDSIEDELDEIEEQIEELQDEENGEYNVPVEIKVNGKKIDLGKDFSNVFGNTFGNMFGGEKNSKTNDLVAALPFIDKEDLHELAEKILSNSEEYKDLNLVAVMPFLSKEDCDNLFMRFVIEGKNTKYPLVTLAPFVSKPCLSKLVDEYINGNFPEVEINLLYPFLDNKDVKRLFNYILFKKDNSEN